MFGLQDLRLVPPTRQTREVEEEGGCEMVQQALLAGRTMLEMVMEAERSGAVPGVEDLCDKVVESDGLGPVGRLVTENLVKAALHYWKIEMESPFSAYCEEIRSRQ